MNSDRITDKIIKDAICFVKELFAGEFSGHDHYHTMRVYQTAGKLAQTEQADIRVVQLAALLHDVDDRKLSPETCRNKDRAVAFMREQQMPEETIAVIVRIIDEVSFAGSDSRIPSTIEGKCVQDADRLDAIGAIGIARAFAFGGSHQRPMYEPGIPPRYHMNAEEYQNHVASSVNHFYEKLFLIKDMLNTEAARELAERRDLFMRNFLNEFLREWNGED